MPEYLTACAALVLCAVGAVGKAVPAGVVGGAVVMASAEVVPFRDVVTVDMVLFESAVPLAVLLEPGPSAVVVK